MRNEKGITLVELLAVLAIAGIIMVLISSVLLNGSDASQRTASKQQLQQEANYIVEVIRSEYLKLENQQIEVKIEETNNRQILKMNARIISEGYDYRLITPAAGIINPNINVNFELELSARDVKPFIIKTKFSKLR